MASQMEERADTRSESLGANCGVTLSYTHKELQEEQFEEKPGLDHGEHKGSGCTLCHLCPHKWMLDMRKGAQLSKILEHANVSEMDMSE